MSNPSGETGHNPEDGEHKKKLTEQLIETTNRYEEVLQRVVRQRLGGEIYKIVVRQIKRNEEAQEGSDEEDRNDRELHEVFLRTLPDVTFDEQLSGTPEALFEDTRTKALADISAEFAPVLPDEDGVGYTLHDCYAEGSSIELTKPLSSRQKADNNYEAGFNVLEVRPKGKRAVLWHTVAAKRIPQTEEEHDLPDYKLRESKTTDWGDDSEEGVATVIHDTIAHLNRALDVVEENLTQKKYKEV